MKITYRISAKAIEDLENIWLYTSKTWSKKQADRYYNLLLTSVNISLNILKMANQWKI